jgi:hypothetical protein
MGGEAGSDTIRVWCCRHIDEKEHRACFASFARVVCFPALGCVSHAGRGCGPAATIYGLFGGSGLFGGFCGSGDCRERRRCNSCALSASLRTWETQQGRVSSGIRVRRRVR